MPNLPAKNETVSAWSEQEPTRGTPANPRYRLVDARGAHVRYFLHPDHTRLFLRGEARDVGQAMMFLDVCPEIASVGLKSGKRLWRA